MVGQKGTFLVSSSSELIFIVELTLLLLFYYILCDLKTNSSTTERIVKLSSIWNRRVHLK